MGRFLSALRLPVSLNDDREVAKMADSSRSYKSSRARDLLPSVRPSYVSLLLVFVSGFLWLKNEATNDRLLAVENRLQMLPRNVALRMMTYLLHITQEQLLSRQ